MAAEKKVVKGQLWRPNKLSRKITKNKIKILATSLTTKEALYQILGHLA